jgi:hypothetical protein
MASCNSKDIQPRTLSITSDDRLPRAGGLTPSSPRAGGNLGQTAHEGLVPFGVERDDEIERDKE